MFSGPFRKQGVIILATYRWIYKKGDNVDITEWVMFRMECLPDVTTTKQVYRVARYAIGYQAAKGKVLAKRTNAHY